MRFSLFVCTAAVAAAAAVPSALGQEPGLGGADRPKVTFEEVEHGVYTGGEGGFLLLAVPGGNKGIGTGAVIGASLGWDFSPYVGIGIFALALSVSAPTGYTGFGDPSALGGDFSGVMPGIEARLHLPIAKDSNDIARLFFNVGAGGGFMFITPASLFPSSGDAPGARLDLGLEYFTRIRHFSIGLGLEFLAAFPSGGPIVGGDLSPFIRYSF